MRAAVPPIAEWVAPPQWQTVDCLSDLHLDAAHPRTLAALLHTLQRSSADAVVLLGDVFEVWVGDDSIDEPGSFEHQVCTGLRAATRRKPVFFMHGNRDFLIGSRFAQVTGITLLTDPSVLTLSTRRWLLSHGDALCLEDTDYQRFRALVRDPDWQAQFLTQPLPERRAQGRSARSESQARQQLNSPYADVDGPSAIAWLQAAQATAFIHGHTHRPGAHALAPGLTRYVLSDWDQDPPPHQPSRADLLRLSPEGIQRLPLSAV